MKGIVIAAGLGSRMGEIQRPKCMLPVAGRPLLHHTVDCLRSAGCETVVVITGHLGHLVECAGITKVENRDFRNNNILHSFMYARDFLDGPVLATYSDIWVEPRVYRQLLETPGDVVLAADLDWQDYYEDRDRHPESEAENVYLRNGTVTAIGKHLTIDGAQSLLCGEFTGLWRMSATGAKSFHSVFQELDAQLASDTPFQHATKWRNAYLTDMFEELIDRGLEIACAAIERGWAELDTDQDYARLKRIAERQHLNLTKLQSNNGEA